MDKLPLSAQCVITAAPELTQGSGQDLTWRAEQGYRWPRFWVMQVAVQPHPQSGGIQLLNPVPETKYCTCSGKVRVQKAI